jgi:hypothetical protein
VVTGILEPASPTVRVTALRADEFVQTTVRVEVRGKLASWREQIKLRKMPDERIPMPEFPALDESGPIVSWWIYFDDGKYAELDFGEREELLALARKLDGQTVDVKGTRVEGRINVSEMKVVPSACRETVVVKIQGVLGCEFEQKHVWPFEPRLADKVTRLAGWQITAEEKTYKLDFSGNSNLERRALLLVNKTVVLTGTLKDGLVTVTGLAPADSADSHEWHFQLSAPPM